MALAQQTRFNFHSAQLCWRSDHEQRTIYLQIFGSRTLSVNKKSLSTPARPRQKFYKIFPTCGGFEPISDANSAAVPNYYD